MKLLMFNPDKSVSTPIYIQLYDYIRGEIIENRIDYNSKLPSIRELATSLKISRTTIESAYSQLQAEGYISSKPQSGYYVNTISSTESRTHSVPESSNNPLTSNVKNDYYFDNACFDFFKWKKCSNNILTYDSDELLFEALPQGEEKLRKQLSSYVYQSRGVKCTPDQIVISAGTQQIISILCLLLDLENIKDIAFEDPGFYPARNIFTDRGFNVLPVKVTKKGINIKELQETNSNVVYVSPSHQFPMGSIMPIGNRFELLKWANKTNSIIIEDDYDSELRYSGKPIPSLQGLDDSSRVIYLGSFSTTLFSSLKISYMVLPQNLLEKYYSISNKYFQTTSKTEQLTLSLYLQQGLYQKHLKKLRKLYISKIEKATASIDAIMNDYTKILSSPSGTYLLLEVRSKKSDAELVSLAASIKISVSSLNKYKINLDSFHPSGDSKKKILLFHYTNIPVDKIENAIKELHCLWKES